MWQEEVAQKCSWTGQTEFLGQNQHTRRKCTTCCWFKFWSRRTSSAVNTSWLKYRRIKTLRKSLYSFYLCMFFSIIFPLLVRLIWDILSHFSLLSTFVTSWSWRHRALLFLWIRRNVNPQPSAGTQVKKKTSFFCEKVSNKVWKVMFELILAMDRIILILNVSFLRFPECLS